MSNKFLKPVSFNRSTEIDIIEHIEALDIPFASYVKKLIKQDMESKQEQSEVAELVSVMKDMLNRGMMMPQPMYVAQGTVAQAQPQLPKDPDEDPIDKVSTQQKKAVNNILKQFKK